jgi:hypothetical protein
VPTDPVDLFLYSGKHAPSLYLDERVRQGISTFANLAEADDVARGLLQLKDDIASGAIGGIVAGYSSDVGDYLFLVTMSDPD